MANEQIKAIATRVVEAINQRHLDLLDELIADDAQDHAVPLDMPPTREATKIYINQLLSAFPDFRYTIEITVSEKDKVMQRLRARGTMMGDFWGFHATRKKATWSESHISRFSGGKLVEHWAYFDQADILQQLGLTPGLV
jgi:predicted ester cyclase